MSKQRKATEKHCCITWTIRDGVFIDIDLLTFSLRFANFQLQLVRISTSILLRNILRSIERRKVEFQGGTWRRVARRTSSLRGSFVFDWTTLE